MYVVCKVVVSMKQDDFDMDNGKVMDVDKWCLKLFGLVFYMIVLQWIGLEMIFNGLLEVLIEIFKFCIKMVQFNWSMVVVFFDMIVYNYMVVFLVFSNVLGFDVIVDFIIYVVYLFKELVEKGLGIKFEFYVQLVDYGIFFYYQQMVKWLFKFFYYILQSLFLFGVNIDCLLRNLVDNFKLLVSFCIVIEELCFYGFVVWINVVMFLSDFFNNDFISFVVFLELGMVQSFLSIFIGEKVGFF